MGTATLDMVALTTAAAAIAWVLLAITCGAAFSAGLLCQKVLRLN